MIYGVPVEVILLVMLEQAVTEGRIHVSSHQRRLQRNHLSITFHVPLELFDGL